MEETIEEITINLDGIDVVSTSHGISRLPIIEESTQKDEIDRIFEKYNLDKIIIYNYDIQIVQALENSEEQIRDYLETCKKIYNSNNNIEIPETIPKIIYDLKDLKNSFLEIEDSNLRIIKQIEKYKVANKTKQMFKKSKGKVEVIIGWKDRVYFTVQEFLKSRNSKKLRALNPGLKQTQGA